MLSAEECLESLKTMDSGKSAGTDSLPAEFYKVFWEDVSTFLIDAYRFPKVIFQSRREED